MRNDLLESWKEIAAYLDRGVRTVQRWEKQEGLPVKRHTHEKLGTVYAFQTEIDEWWESRRAALTKENSRTDWRSSSAWSYRSLLVVGACFVALVTIGSMGFIWSESDGATPSQLRAIPITTLSGSEYFPSFSPDGSQVAFTWIAPGKPVDIYTKTVGSESVHQVTSDGGVDLAPAWSPDGRWIAFLRGDRIRDRKREVLVVPAQGGSTRKLGETHPDWGPFLAWERDSGGLIYSWCKPPKPCRLKLVDMKTLEERMLTSPPAGPGGDTAPALSPDGRSLLFVRRSGGHTACVYLQRMDEDFRPAGEAKPMTGDAEFATAPAWSSDGLGFFYMTGDVGVSMKLWKTEASSGTAPQFLATLGDTFFEPGLTVHEDRLIAMDLRVDTNIRSLSLDEKEFADSSVTLTRSNRIDRFPHISPDGSEVAFESTRHGGSEILVMDAAGSNVRQVTSLGVDGARTPRWSPDGSQIAFSGGAPRGDIYLVSASGGEPKLVFGGPADDSLPSWSSNGQDIYFTSDSSGQYEVWTIAAGGGEASQVTSEGGYRPIASPDGSFVYYTKRQSGAVHGSPLWRVSTDGGDEEQVFATPVFHPENFEVLEGKIYYASSSSTGKTKGIRVFDLANGEDREIAHTGPAPSTGLSVSRDGRIVLFAHTDSRESDLVEFKLP